MTLSVALCTHNGEKYIRKQLESILEQELQVNEIIISDDNSTDKTWSILKQLQKQYPNILKIFKNEINLGVVKNFENAIDNCSGDLIFLSDQDDIWFKNKTRNIANYLRENPQINAVIHNLTILNNGNPGITLWDSLLFSKNDRNLSNKDLFDQLLVVGNFVTGAALAFRKQSVTFYEIKYLLHDYQLALKFTKEDKLGVLDEVLGYYRVHSDQQVGTTIKPSNAKKNLLELMQKKNVSIEVLNHLQRKYFQIKELSEFDNNYQSDMEKIEKKLILKRNLFLRQKTFYIRKLYLIKWFYRRLYVVDFKDLFTV